MLQNCGFLFPNNHSPAFFASPDRPPNGQKGGKLDDGRIACDVHGGARTEPPAAKSVDDKQIPRLRAGDLNVRYLATIPELTGKDGFSLVMASRRRAAPSG